MRKEFEAIINNNPKIKKLYDDVKQKIELQGKKLYIMFNTSSSRKEFLGQAEEAGEQIVISIDTSLIDNKEKLIAVLIHELGEADYIACKLPKVTSQNENFKCEESVKQIREILSHNHIRRIINKYKLNDEIQNLGIVLRHAKLKDNSYKAIRTIHDIMTYFWCENIQCESEIKPHVQKIKQILDDADTLNNDINMIEERYKKVIDIILKELNYPIELIFIKR